MKELTREQWLEERRSGIGGSDAAAVLGVNPWKSPLELWSEKTGLVPAPDLSENEAVEFGRKLESIVLETLAERTGRKIDRWPQTEIVRHAHRDWMLCTPDAYQVDADRGQGIVQAKTTNTFARKDWEGEEPPLHYQVQIQHEMEVVGAEWGTLCCLIGGQRFAWFDVERNERFIGALVDQERRFWDLVERGVPPEADESASCSHALAKLFPLDNGESIALPPEAEDWDDELQRIKNEIKLLEKERRGLENKFKAAIGDATIGVLPDGSSYSLKTQIRKEYVVKESTFRVLRRLK